MTKTYFETIQECQLFNGGTNLSEQKYDIDKVFKIIEQAKKEVFDDLEKLKFKKGQSDKWIFHHNDIAINSSTYRKLKQRHR